MNQSVPRKMRTPFSYTISWKRESTEERTHKHRTTLTGLHSGYIYTLHNYVWYSKNPRLVTNYHAIPTITEENITFIRIYRTRREFMNCACVNVYVHQCTSINIHRVCTRTYTVDVNLTYTCTRRWDKAHTTYLVFVKI